MNRTQWLSFLLVFGLVATLTTAARADDKDKPDNKKPEPRAKARPAEPESPQRIVAQAKLTRQQAERIALAKVPRAKVRSADLQMQDGVLVWAVDLAVPDTGLMAQVAVNAVTGAVVKMDLAAPKPEAKPAQKEKPEAKAERKEAKAERKEVKAEAKEAKAERKDAKAAKPEAKAKAPKPKDQQATKTKPAKRETRDRDDD